MLPIREYPLTMTRATREDKKLIVSILSSSFQDNKSTNYIVKQDDRRNARLQKLIEYSYEVCSLFGEVFLSNDRKACALILLPEKKRTTLRSIILDARLAFSVIGLSNIKKAMSRESKISKLHPTSLFYYLWFIGVDPADQGKGIGTDLLNEVIGEAAKQNRPIYLETSTLKNIPWYKKFGFVIYHTLDFGYELYCMKRE